MAKLIYEKPKAELVQFDNSDVITTSGPGCKYWQWLVEASCDFGQYRKEPGWEVNICFIIGKECGGELHKATSGECWWVNGNFSIGDDEW